MAKYIKRIRYENVGPIASIDIELPFNSDGLPKPLLIVGENGCGKTSLLSNIADSFYEIAGRAFNDARAYAGDTSFQFFKEISPTEIRVGQGFLYTLIDYSDGNSYVFKAGNLSFEEMKTKCPDISESFNWGEESNDKETTFDKSQAEELFQREVVCFFGSGRYEKPVWMGELYFDDLKKSQTVSIEKKFTRHLANPISANACLEANIRWILDLIVDSRADLAVGPDGKFVLDHDTNAQDVILFTSARKSLDEIISNIVGCPVYLKLKYRNAGGRRLCIQKVDDNCELAPTLEALSTGQTCLLNLFCTIIRYADVNDINKAINVADIEGIVLIDEADLHLHVEHQRKVLPRLLKMFPKVQFIITTHSPLLPLGMEEEYGEGGIEIIELPDGRPIKADSFYEFGHAFDCFRKTKLFANTIERIASQHANEALIITEGTTDWRHIEAAKKYYQENGFHQELFDTPYEFLRYGPKIDEYCTQVLEMGNDALVKACKQAARIPQTRPLIFIADSDDANTTKALSGNPVKSWGNGVFSFVVPTPSFREQDEGICIEQLYPDRQITQEVECADGITRRLYLSNEFDDDGCSRYQDFVCIGFHKPARGRTAIIDGGCCRVRRIDDETRRNLALRKTDFANAVFNGSIEVSFDAFLPLFEMIYSIICSKDNEVIEEGDNE